MCSAKLEKRDSQLNAKVDTAMRRISRDWDWGRGGLGVAATCFAAAAVFNEQERAGAMKQSTLSLESVTFHATATYKPSLLGRVLLPLVSTYGFESG